MRRPRDWSTRKVRRAPSQMVDPQLLVISLDFSHDGGTTFLPAPKPPPVTEAGPLSSPPPAPRASSSASQRSDQRTGRHLRRRHDMDDGRVRDQPGRNMDRPRLHDAGSGCRHRACVEAWVTPVLRRPVDDVRQWAPPGRGPLPARRSVTSLLSGLVDPEDPHGEELGAAAVGLAEGLADAVDLNFCEHPSRSTWTPPGPILLATAWSHETGKRHPGGPPPRSRVGNFSDRQWGKSAIRTPCSFDRLSRVGQAQTSGSWGSRGGQGFGVMW